GQSMIFRSSSFLLLLNLINPIRNSLNLIIDRAQTTHNQIDIILQTTISMNREMGKVVIRTTNVVNNLRNMIIKGVGDVLFQIRNDTCCNDHLVPLKINMSIALQLLKKHIFNAGVVDILFLDIIQTDNIQKT